MRKLDRRANYILRLPFGYTRSSPICTLIREFVLSGTRSRPERARLLLRPRNAKLYWTLMRVFEWASQPAGSLFLPLLEILRKLAMVLAYVLRLCCVPSSAPNSFLPEPLGLPYYCFVALYLGYPARAGEHAVAAVVAEQSLPLRRKA